MLHRLALGGAALAVPGRLGCRCVAEGPSMLKPHELTGLKVCGLGYSIRKCRAGRAQQGWRVNR